MELNIINLMQKKDEKKKIKLSPEIFNNKFNEALVHQIITSYLSNSRSAIKAEKNRSKVRGGGIKPFRQKGTGKARAGSIRSPIWKGGGKTFTADVKRNYEKKINKKMYKAAMRCIISELIKKKRFLVINNFPVETPKTKNVILNLKFMNIFSGLLIKENIDKNLYLSSKNIPNFFIRNPSNINPLILIKNKNVVITMDALKELERLLA